jgi:hypothetical protein
MEFAVIKENWMKETRKHSVEYGQEYIDKLEAITDGTEFFKTILKEEGLSEIDLPDEALRFL